MDEKSLAVMEAMIGKAVKETVNGKISALDAKLDAHMEEIKPFIQAKASASFLYKLFLSVGSLAAAWLAVKSIVPFKF